jgi:hypothetical protein
MNVIQTTIKVLLVAIFACLKSSNLTKQKKSQLPQQLELEIEDTRYYMLVKTLYCKYNIVNGQKELSYVLLL